MVYVLVALVLLVAGGVGFWAWRRWQENRNHRLVSIVVLLKKPKRLNPARVAAAARRAWNADLSEGEDERGRDGFVVGTDLNCMALCRDRMTLINSFPIPYVPDPGQAAADILDSRLSRLMAAHQGWLSCDAMDVDRHTPDDEVQDWYRHLGKLCAELLDDNCLAIYLPDTGDLFEYDATTADRLRSGNVTAALDDGRQCPVIHVPEEDPRMRAAVAEARRRWGEFVTAYETRAGQNFSAKVPLTRDGNTEFIWLNVTALEHDSIYGTLGNEPMHLPGLKFGSKVKAKLAKLNDWCYITPAGALAGGFTVKVIEEVVRAPKQRSQ